MKFNWPSKAFLSRETPHLNSANAENCSPAAELFGGSGLKILSRASNRMSSQAQYWQKIRWQVPKAQIYKKNMADKPFRPNHRWYIEDWAYFPVLFFLLVRTFLYFSFPSAYFLLLFFLLVRTFIYFSFTSAYFPLLFFLPVRTVRLLFDFSEMYI